MVESEVVSKFSAGEGGCLNIIPIDMLVMPFSVLKYGASWSFCAFEFKSNQSTFERLMSSVLNTTAVKLLKRNIEDVENGT